MDNYAGERWVDHATERPTGSPTLLDFLITRLADPAAVMDASLTVVSANDAFAALADDESQSVGEPITTVLPELSEDAIGGDTPEGCVTVRTADTPAQWTEFRFDSHGSHVLCVGRDVTGADGRRLDETLGALQTSTRTLLAARTKAEVAAEIADVATDALGLSGATLYLFDACRNVLWPAGVAGVPGGDARTAVGGDDGGIVREVFLDGIGTTADGDRYQPLGDHGVLHTVASDRREGGQRSERGGREQRDERTVARVDRLAESARAALDRVDHEATLRERDASQRHHAERAAELERALSLLRRVQRSLGDADSVAEIEQAVCAALLESEWLSFAWIGRLDGDTVEPRTWAGSDAAYLEDVPLSVDGVDAPPAAQTAASNRPTAVDSVAEAIGEHHWARAAIARDFQSAISVPLRADGVDYGVLTAYADQPVEWGDPLASVFSELGDSVAAAISDRERLDRLAGGTGVELDLTVHAPADPLGRLAATLGETVCCTDAIPVDGTTTRCFLSVPGAEGDVVADAVETLQGMDSPVAVAEGDRYELLVRETSVVGQVVRHGGRLDTACVTGEELSLTVTLAADADVRTFVDRLGEDCESVQLSARRHQPATPRARGGIRSSLESSLTDRQLEALLTAYGSGFFEWPRETTGEGVAEMLGVTQPTANRHLRVSQRKLLELVFDEC